MLQLRQKNKRFSLKSSLLGWICSSLILFLCLSFYNQHALAKPNTKTIKPSATLVDYLIQEKIHLNKDLEISKKSPPVKTLAQYKERKQFYTGLATITGAKISSLEGFLENQKRYHNKLVARLKNLQQLPLANPDIIIPERVAKVEALLVVNKKNIDLLDENLELTQGLQTQVQETLKDLEQWHAHYLLALELASIKTQKTQLKTKLNALYQINMAAKEKGLDKNPINSEARFLLNNQKIALIHNQLAGYDLQKQVIRAKMLILKNYNTKSLQQLIDSHGDSVYHFAQLEKSYNNMLALIENEASLQLDKSLKATLKELEQDIHHQLTTNKVQREHLLQNMADYQNQLKKLISSRQSMAEYNLNSWPIIFKKITNIPALFYKYSKTLSLKVYDSFLWLDTLHRTIFAFLLSGLLVLSLVTQRLLKSINRDKERTSLSGFLYDGFLTVVERNVPYLFLFAILFTTFYMMNIAFVNYQLLMNLLGVWLAFRVFILIARLSLLERISDSSGSDVKLYYRLKWLLLFGGWTTAMMTFSHMLPLSLILQDIFNRLFMLFILTISLVAWRSKDVIRLLLRPMLKGKKRYLKNAILSVVVLIPITLFTTAAIGLLGFINLAWTMSTYQAYLVVVLAGFILARGLIFDLLDVFSEWMISSLDNGWLWIEVFLKPLDKILRVGLFLFSILILFQLFGWHSDSLVMVGLENLAQHTIINITGIHITVASMLEFLILVPIFVWASKWTREFCYRWLYVKAKDPGIRNSLSVFTQYSVILLGGFIALRVLGLDFSGMSMILGGLAVGMGFGLRDFASNIVGGLMLLIERPVREGDLISIGEYEGQVSHIGIRSMRVSSWDNTEVLIPNAETFNKPFTNWTHQDGIVRTQIPIKVSRSDDPVMIQQLILDVLAIMPEIVAEPPAQVFLKKIDTALIEFEARYFINVQIHNRVEIRSKVLFAITAQFKAAGVLPPVEPITVELKDGSIEFLNKKESTTN